MISSNQEGMPFDDALNAEIRRASAALREQARLLPWTDKDGNIMPSPTPKAIDITQIGR